MRARRGERETMAPTAVITGISGQDGSYLAELLLSKGYEVHGIVLRGDTQETARRLAGVPGLAARVSLHAAPPDSAVLGELLGRLRPDECYHLAARSYVPVSSEEEFTTFQVNVTGTHQMISAVRAAAPGCRFFFASSSEVFGRAESTPQDERTPFHPRSVYGITKAAGHFLTSHYRDSQRLYACSAILYNHESPRRGEQFVTRKITRGAARIKLGLERELRLGNLDARRDWGFAGDYVEAMWRMLQQPQPADYVIASGQAHSVREFCQAAFGRLGLDYREFVAVDERFYRPAEAVTLAGDAARARAALDWQPRVAFEELVEHMVDEDLRLASAGQA